VDASFGVIYVLSTGLRNEREPGLTSIVAGLLMAGGFLWAAESMARRTESAPERRIWRVMAGLSLVELGSRASVLLGSHGLRVTLYVLSLGGDGLLVLSCVAHVRALSRRVSD